MLKIGNIMEIKNIGIGKIVKIYEKEDYNECGTIVIDIAGQKYYRDMDKDHNIIDTLNDTNITTEKEYVQYLKSTIKQLTALSSNKRKEASEYNKSVNGLATKRKGKVSVIDGNIMGFCENSLSSYHRSLLNNAKKLKEIKDQLKQELQFYKKKGV